MPQPKSYVRTDEHGVMRIGDSRVMLDSVVASFPQGHSPETIQQRYPALNLESGASKSRQTFQSCFAFATVARPAPIKSICSDMSRPWFLTDHDLNEPLIAISLLLMERTTLN